MRALSVATIVGGFVCFSSPSASQMNLDFSTPASVYEMLPTCQYVEEPKGQLTDFEHARLTICINYIEGIGTMMVNNCALSVISPYKMIADKEKRPSIQAAAQAFVNWARKHPERWGEDKWRGVASALSSTFPCAN